VKCSTCERVWNIKHGLFIILSFQHTKKAQTERSNKVPEGEKKSQRSWSSYKAQTSKTRQEAQQLQSWANCRVELIIIFGLSCHPYQPLPASLLLCRALYTLSYAKARVGIILTWLFPSNFNQQQQRKSSKSGDAPIMSTSDTAITPPKKANETQWCLENAHDIARGPAQQHCLLPAKLGLWQNRLKGLARDNHLIEDNFFFFFFWWGLLHGPQQGPDRMKEKTYKTGKRKTPA